MRQVESLTRGNFSPKGALNIALLDGAAKRRGQPLSEFLGLSFAEGKHVSSITIGLDSPSMTRQKVREAEAFPILKLKSARGMTSKIWRPCANRSAQNSASGRE